MGDTWRGVETSKKTGETDQGVKKHDAAITMLENIKSVTQYCVVLCCVVLNLPQTQRFVFRKYS
jgi:hypothetical protein